jgi:hypothetical protein
MATTDINKKDIMKNSIDKIKLVDAGVKDKYGYNTPMPLKSNSDMKNKIYYPHICLDTKEAPMLSGCDVGEEITLLIKASVVSHSVNEDENKKCEDFRLEIKQIGVVSTDKVTPNDGVNSKK